MKKMKRNVALFLAISLAVSNIAHCKPTSSAELSPDESATEILFKGFSTTWEKFMAGNRRPQSNNGIQISDDKGSDIPLSTDENASEEEVRLYENYLFPTSDGSGVAAQKATPKHIVFVLDVSGSMGGDKISQLKDAMATILSDLDPQDHFSIMTFSDNTKLWQLNVAFEMEAEMAGTYPATSNLVSKATSYVNGLSAEGGTNINDALIQALETVMKGQTLLETETIPAIIFLTDGQPTSGETDSSVIRSNIKARNNDIKVPIFGLAFGAGADYGLILRISLDNRGFARKVFADADAEDQLKDFYVEITRSTWTPLLSHYCLMCYTKKGSASAYMKMVMSTIFPEVDRFW